MTASPRQIKQVPDDQDLLSRMMNELEHADELYKPTNYWRFYENLFLPELKRNGLYNFRRRKYSILDSFGATDISFKGRILPKIKIRGMGRIAQILDEILWKNPIFPLVGLTHSNPEWVTQYFYRYVNNKFNKLNFDFSVCSTSLYGNPEDIVEIEKGFWSFTHLGYCSQVADAANYIRFNDKMIICELGTGMGRNMEILANLFPQATLLLFDIPPQLYVANQYLTAVFGERVLSYKEAVGLKPKNNKEFSELIRGKMIILPSWALPAWSVLKIDLFWNSASFQEMEPEVVRNYLELVKKMTPQYIYINALIEGNYWGTWKPGRGGTKVPIWGKYYGEFLKDKYQLMAEYDTDLFLRINDHRSYIFELNPD